MEQKEIDLEKHFPDMQLVEKAPGLVTVNGCGTAMYGRRDHDAETDTCVKTLCFALLFVPIIPLRAYRVTDSRQGWYFLGRVPLSAFAKTWNFLLLAAAISGGASLGFEMHRNSPESRARRDMEAADALRSEGKMKDCAELYSKVASSKTSLATAARASLWKLVDQNLDDMPSADASKVLGMTIALEQSAGTLKEKRDALLAKGLDLARANGQVNPRGALQIVDAVAVLAEQQEAIDEVREVLLEQAIEKEPRDAALVSDLALLFEKRGDLERAEELLKPHAETLGTLEGARILGQIYTRQLKVEEASRLLTPYVESRLDRLHEVEQAYRDAVDRVWNNGVAKLQKGNARGFNYKAYERLNDQQQSAMVQKYLEGLVQRSGRVTAAQQEYAKVTAVVPVTLELAMVRIQHAQGLQDPETRRRELEGAEKLFLAIRGLAEESNEFRLYYGQVCYWLGKHDEGRKLFDDLLAANQRSHEMLMSTATVLREVGAETYARSLMEEAYENADDDKKKYAAAGLRALCAIDTDDEIKWLKRCDPSEPHTKASLALALGTKAMQEQKNEAAAGHFRKALESYIGMPKTSGSLNNASLASSYLYRVTGERSDFRRSLRLMDEAYQLQPGNSILLFNLAEVSFQSAVMDTVGDAVDLIAIKRAARMDLISFLYTDEARRDRYVNKLKAHPDFEKSMACYRKNLLLSPKSARTYQTIHQILSFNRDLEGLRALAERLEKASPDVSELISQRKEYLAGKKDQEYKQRYESVLKSNEEMVRSLSSREQPTEFAIAVATLVTSLQEAYTMGRNVDADELVDWAEKAHDARDSSQTQAGLAAALFFRAARTLATKSSAFAQIAQEHRRAIHSSHLLAFAISENASCRKQLLNEPDMKRAVALLRKMVQAFPSSLDGMEWAFLRAFYPQDEPALRKRLLGDELNRINRGITLLISPLNSAAVLEQYFVLLAEGKEAQAKALLKTQSEAGTPIPFLAAN